MSFANEHWFNRPETRVRATGYKSSINPERRYTDVVVSDQGYEMAMITNGGIVDPQLRQLGLGTVLVRFGSSVFVDQVAAGEWWLEFEQYRIVEKYADANAISVPMAMRQLCCVPLDWGAMTTVVQGRVIRPLLAYEGPGAPATGGKGTDYLDGQAAAQLGLKQLYIPGLSDPDLRRDSLWVTDHGFLPHEMSRLGYVPRKMPHPA
ncbi:hypothetical protein [Novosphingobium resinovorum]|uniref:hypothetical protein n=1 Tax=Novosphingobium resinovorum TaxID=158500 RepID=UPI002ED48BC6|nr:hypothetical protein [Novosphingobium resinovorum]